MGNINSIFALTKKLGDNKEDYYFENSQKLLSQNYYPLLVTPFFDIYGCRMCLDQRLILLNLEDRVKGLQEIEDKYEEKRKRNPQQNYKIQESVQGFTKRSKESEEITDYLVGYLGESPNTSFIDESDYSIYKIDAWLNEASVPAANLYAISKKNSPKMELSKFDTVYVAIEELYDSVKEAKEGILSRKLYGLTKEEVDFAVTQTTVFTGIEGEGERAWRIYLIGSSDALEKNLPKYPHFEETHKKIFEYSKTFYDENDKKVQLSYAESTEGDQYEYVIGVEWILERDLAKNNSKSGNHFGSINPANVEFMKSLGWKNAFGDTAKDFHRPKTPTLKLNVNIGSFVGIFRDKWVNVYVYPFRRKIMKLKFNGNGSKNILENLFAQKEVKKSEIYKHLDSIFCEGECPNLGKRLILKRSIINEKNALEKKYDFDFCKLKTTDGPILESYLDKKAKKMYKSTIGNSNNLKSYFENDDQLRKSLCSTLDEFWRSMIRDSSKKFVCKFDEYQNQQNLKKATKKSFL